MKIHGYTKNCEKRLECIYYNAQHNGFTLQYPLLLASLTTSDSEETIRTKIRIVSTYLDTLIARRFWDSKSIAYNTMVHDIFLVIQKVRELDKNELIQKLTQELQLVEKKSPSFGKKLLLHDRNRKQIHYLLARITDYIEIESGQPSKYLKYSNQSKSKYEIEHILANHPELHEDEFEDHSHFRQYRAYIGSLLLLPIGSNRSYGDMTYEDKLICYRKENLLARSLHEKCYSHDAGFTEFVKRSELPFESHSHFGKDDMDKRYVLYQGIAKRIWDPELIRQAADES